MSKPQLRRLRKRISPAAKRRAKARRTPNYRRPLVFEQLEDRRVLAAVSVSTTFDVLDVDSDTSSIANLISTSGADGAISLREAVIASNNTAGPDTINLPAGTYTLTMGGANEDAAATGDLDITDALTISGAGAASTIIDATGLGDRVFHIPLVTGAGINVNFLGITITKGLATDAGSSGLLSGAAGGGILNEELGSAIMIADSVVTENTALGGFFAAGQGGGLADVGGNWTVDNTEITNNNASGGESAAGRGGGFHKSLPNTSTLLIDSTIAGNEAVGGDDSQGLGAGIGEGGGIYNEGGTWTSIGSTMIDSNMAKGGAGFVGSLAAGGSASGGGIYDRDGSWSFTLNPGSTISGNGAIGGEGGVGGEAKGGGVFSDGGSFEFENNTISGNLAVGGDVVGIGTVGGNAKGGGVHAENFATFEFDYVTVAFNQANGGFGPTSGTGAAGGVFSDDIFTATTILHSTIVATNTASTSDPDLDGTFIGNVPVSTGFNLIGDVGSATGVTNGFNGNQVGGGINSVIDPLIDSLANNGGPTETHKLMPGSPAIDAANPNSFPAFDQRGTGRPADGDGDTFADPDIGAYEAAATMGAAGIDIEKFTRVDVNPIDIQKLVRVESPSIDGDVCEVLGNPLAMTFQYLPDSTVDTAQDPSKAKILFQGSVDDDGVSYVVVTDKDDPNKALVGDGKIFFSSEVAFGEYFEVNEDVENFGSTTYLHFFDDATGGLLQTVEYHTSCSQPIQLGDVIGNVTLAGYEGEDGRAEVADLGPGVNDDDADLPTGSEAVVGDTVVFTYVVSNPISGTEISNIQVTDEVLAPVPAAPFSPDPVLDGGFNVGDTDMDNRLDFGEEWLYVSNIVVTETTLTGQHIDKATVVGNGGELFDLDPAHFTVAAVPPIQGGVCDELGNPIALTFEYAPGTTVQTAQDSGKAEILFDSGAFDDDGISFVIATDKENASDALAGEGKRFFEGNVAFNATFVADEDLDSFGSTTFIHFFDDATGGLLQSIEYHTSCSQPIQLGDVIGNVTLVAYEGEDGSAALLPPSTPPDVDLGGGIIFATDNPFDPGNIGEDADDPTGPVAQPGDKVTYTYQVSNPGFVPVTIQELVDDNETPGDPSDDFTPAPILMGGFNVGDLNMDNLVDPGEVWYFQVMEIATEFGQHTNTAKITVEGPDESSFTTMFESEDFDAAQSPWQVFNSPDASGGQYIAAPNGTGSHYDTPPSGKSVTYTFSVHNAGEYEISGLVKAPTSNDNSFWVQVDGGPWIEWHTDVTGNSFDWQVVTSQSPAGTQKVSLQNGAGGYSGTSDTFTDEFEPNTNKGSQDYVAIDLFDGGTDATTQGLIRFDDIFGSGPGQIPLGSTILSASLTVDVNNPSDPAATISLHQMLVDWNESSTWNSLSGGVSTNDMEAASSADAYIASPSTTGFITVTGLESRLQAWLDAPSTNNGWVIVSDNDNGWDFRSSEYATVSRRPQLNIAYQEPSTQDQVTFDLGVGQHTLVFKVREDGTQLDKIMVSQTGSSGTLAMDSDASNHIVNPLAIEKYVFATAPPSGGVDLCDEHGKPQQLTFQYTGGGENATNTAQPDGKFEVVDAVPGGPNDATTVLIRSTDKSSATDLSGKIFFTGLVDLDAEFTIAGDFGSNTFVHIFDETGSTLLQTVQYHTSCSAPIVLGDIVGGVTVTGFLGEDGEQIDLNPNGPLGNPADSPTGPVVLEGDEVVFNYEVTNLGNVALTNAQVTDSQLGAVTDIVDNGNGDNLLDPGETWILTTSYVANVPGQRMNLGTVTANSVDDPAGDQFSQSDPAYHFVESIKFFVVDKDDDATYRYTESGKGIDNFDLQNDNSDARGATALADASKLWVLDKDKNQNVYVYDGDGDVIGAWQAKTTLAENDKLPDKVEGIATDGSDIWIVEKDKHQVYFYSGGVSLVTGPHNASSKFSLHRDNDHARGITTDGFSIWVVDDDGSNNRVFKYTVGGTHLGSWSIDPANDKPRGITIDPTGGTSIWIVDQDADQIFQYDGATGLTSGSKSADSVYNLDEDNDKAEGIADPRPWVLGRQKTTEAAPPLLVTDRAAQDRALAEFAFAFDQITEKPAALGFGKVAQPSYNGRLNIVADVLEIPAIDTAYGVHTKGKEALRADEEFEFFTTEDDDRLDAVFYEFGEAEEDLLAETINFEK